MEKKKLTHQHPFIGGLSNHPENRTKELRRIRNWMLSQPHLPEISDEYIYLFLHACYYQCEKTKHAIETYFTLRSNTPSIFGNRDMNLESMQRLMTMGYLVRLPKTTPEGYKILLYAIRDTDCTKFVFNDAVKGFCMYNDCVLSEDGLSEGYVVIFDMKGASIGHLARINLPALRAFMIYIQEAHPARLKAIHVVNTVSFVNHVMRVIQPLLRGEMISLVKFHRGKAPNCIPQEVLPKDYGGEAPSVEELNQQTFDLKDKYHKWLIESEHFVTDESKRMKKNSWWSIFNGTTPNNTIEVNEKDAFNNLQID